MAFTLKNNMKIKGYKMTQHMKCGSLTYQVGKTYKISRVEMCKYGFHFCLKPDDVFEYYPPHKDNILLEVESDAENTVTKGDKSVTSKIKIVRIIPKSEWNNLFKRCKFDGRGNLIIDEINTHDWYKYEYDKNNNKIREEFNNGCAVHWTTWKYDKNNNLTKEEDYTGYCSKRKYDKNNNLIKFENSNGDWKKWEYDKNNNLIKDTETNGSRTKYEYNKNNNLIKKEGNDYLVKYEYDINGNLIKEEYSTDGWTKYEYDSKHNLIKKEYSTGFWIKCEYDNNNIMIKRENSFGIVEEYNLDS